MGRSKKSSSGSCFTNFEKVLMRYERKQRIEWLIRTFFGGSVVIIVFLIGLAIILTGCETASVKMQGSETKIRYGRFLMTSEMDDVKYDRANGTLIIGKKKTEIDAEDIKQSGEAVGNAARTALIGGVK